MTPTPETHPMTTLDQIQHLEALIQNAPDFPDEIMPEDDGSLNCPCCGGDGVVDAESVQHARSNSWPGGVQFYGVGHEHEHAEKFYLAMRNAAPHLLAVAKAAESIPWHEAMEYEGRIDAVLHLSCDQLHAINLALAALKSALPHSAVAMEEKL